MKKIKKYSIVLLTLTFIVLLSCPIVWAVVAANTSITNQARLTYDDGSGGQAWVDAEVIVTVALVPGAPSLNEPADGSTPYTGANTPLPFTYQITANGNGPNTYQVYGTVTGSTNTGGATVSAVQSTPVNVPLGATITTTDSSTTMLQVPSDGMNDGSVNGIEIGNTIVINGEVRTVTAISDPASGTATISWDATQPLTTAPGAGVPVFERQNVTLTVYSGTISTANTDITVSVEVTATSNGTTENDTHTIVATYTTGAAGLTKYVRNVSWNAGNDSGTGAVSFLTNGTGYSYYTDGVVGRPGDTLEYVLVARNSGTNAVNGCSIADVLPEEFVTLLSNAYAASAEVIYRDQNENETMYNAGSDGDQATLTGDTLTVNVGTDATNLQGGIIPAGSAVRITYQVTINP